jgi:S-DNA-T family DNA segregation ATPase FtsK/SpoIIIE
MARTTKEPAPTRLDEHWHKRLREAGFLLLLPLAVYLFACLFSYASADPGWSHAGDPARPIHNFGGAFGAWLADLSFYLLGVVSYTLPILLLVVGYVVLRGATTRERSPLEPTLRLVGFVAFFIAAPGLAWLQSSGASQLPAGPGGILGSLIGASLLRTFGPLGADFSCSRSR